MARKTKKPKWSAKQLSTLYECWKEEETTKARLVLVAERLPDMPQPTALSLMRKLARGDSKWIRWTTRKKNEKERERLEKKKAREQKEADRLSRRQDREKRKLEREAAKADKTMREKLCELLQSDDIDFISEKVPPEFLFCTDIRQYVNNNSCIFRVFSNSGAYNFSHDGPCNKCNRMDKYIPIIKEITDGRQKKRSGRNTPSKKQSKNKVKKSKSSRRKTATAKSRKKRTTSKSG